MYLNQKKKCTCTVQSEAAAMAVPHLYRVGKEALRVWIETRIHCGWQLQSPSLYVPTTCKSWWEKSQKFFLALLWPYLQPDRRHQSIPNVYPIHIQPRKEGEKYINESCGKTWSSQSITKSIIIIIIIIILLYKNK